jgi:uncharacterized protein YdhG (YjbR/CyaY superfamily)
MAGTSTKNATAAKKTSGGFTTEEKAAIKATAKEHKAQATRADGEQAVRDALAGMDDADRALGEKLHAIITVSAPELAPRTYYGMPAYANQEGKVICFYRNARKFNERYGTLGFNDVARLDDGTMWPNGYALAELTAADEQAIAALVAKAVR